MRKNQLKAKLRDGIPCIGTFVRMGAMSVEILGYTGWDFVVVDMEHGVHSLSDVLEMKRTCEAAGLTCIVRVPSPQAVDVMRVLDAGASGVQIPQVTSARQVGELCRAARYAPQGNRGACAFSSAACYSTVPFERHMRESNEEILTVIHIENLQAAQAIDEILETEGIDVVFCGPYDLSQSLGIPGRTEDPQVTQLIDRVLQACRKRKLATGIFVNRPDQLRHWLEKGVTYITCSTDVGLMAEYCTQRAKELRQAIASCGGGTAEK